MKTISSALLLLLPLISFAFDYGPDSPSWYSVNDSVMGGVSRGRPTMMEGSGVRFSGILSLENNGGFSSIRSDSPAYAFSRGKELLVTVKGDGRTYYFDLRTNARQRAFSYRQSFKTVAGEETTVRLPLAGFVATRFGRRMMNDQPLEPSQVKSIGVTLADKKPGPFRLDILNIQLVNPEVTGPSSVEELLTLAIARGVPLYNRGDADACAAVYETALSALVLLPEEKLADAHRKLVTSTLLAAKSDASASDRAWTLRRGMDQLMQ